jgi:hypothetical protein
MKPKPDFKQMSRKDLRKYVLSHREDNEALEIYMERMQTESGVERYTVKFDSEGDFKQLEKSLEKKMKDRLENNTHKED